MSSSKKRIARFFSYYKPYRFLFCMVMLCSVAASAAALILPLCIRALTRDVMAHAASGMPGITGIAMHYGLAMLGLIIVQSACSLFQDQMGHIMGARMERDMRNDLFAHYQRLPFSFFDREKTGEVISRITGDLLNLAELCHHGPEDLVIYFASFIGALAILFHINARLALASCIFLPVMAIYSLFFAGKLNRAYRKNYERIGEVNSRIEDSIGGIKTVKSFGNEELEIRKFRMVNEEYYRSRSSIYRHESWYFTVLGAFLAQLVTVSAVFFGALMLSGQKLAAPDLLSFLLYTAYLTAPIPEFSRIMSQYQDGLAGFRRLCDILETGAEREKTGVSVDRDSAVEETGLPEKIRGEIEFRDVSFSYGGEEEHVFKNISFVIKSGEYAALKGASGIGKTTLCSLIPRFYEASAGRITIDGIDIKTVDIEDLRKRIGVVQQDCYIFSGTVRENIAYGKPGASAEEITAAAERARAHGFIISLERGYDTDLGVRGARLSGGQRQRLCIARVFLKNPPILIFDEATSALDMETERAIQEGLRDLSVNRTTIVIAHRLSTLQHADRILTLDENGIG
ncbi:MAG: ABC transporter ATP-binding protein/permease [Treponema sp.]|jgi:ATP-binding cassette subfamily B protein|nr:ABC transporter ATP-binding protein/permease [Treponema sp.]